MHTVPSRHGEGGETHGTGTLGRAAAPGTRRSDGRCLHLRLGAGSCQSADVGAPAFRETWNWAMVNGSGSRSTGRRRGRRRRDAVGRSSVARPRGRILPVRARATAGSGNCASAWSDRGRTQPCGVCVPRRNRHWVVAPKVRGQPRSLPGDGTARRDQPARAEVPDQGAPIWRWADRMGVSDSRFPRVPDRADPVIPQGVAVDACIHSTCACGPAAKVQVNVVHRHGRSAAPSPRSCFDFDIHGDSPAWPAASACRPARPGR